MERVWIFDTTLRDGEQSPGVALNADQKLEIARALAALRVDVIEAGFPASSPGDFQAVRRIAREVRGCVIAGLARAVPNDVDACWEALRPAEAPRIHIFISSSDIHIMHQLEKNREEVLEMARAMVARARKYCPDVEFSPMDSTRSDRRFVYQMLEAVIDAGATVVNIPDTVGYAVPEEFADFIRSIRENVRNIDRVTISVHCHNDLGLAVANTLAAIRAGARQVEGCINGIGERAGNAALEEVIMALRTRRDFFGVEVGVDTTQIYRVSQLVSQLTGMPVQPNKAIVGVNAFRHQSGVHQHGVVKLRETYEIIDPRDIGLPRGGIIVLNKNSGRAGLQARLKELGYTLSEEEMDRVFRAFKELADQKGEVHDADLVALVTAERTSTTTGETFQLDLLQVSYANGTPTVTVRLVGPGGRVVETTVTGRVPLESSRRTMGDLVGMSHRLVESYQVKTVPEPVDDSLCAVTVWIDVNGHGFIGRGTDPDVIVAASRALKDALSQFLTRGVPPAAHRPGEVTVRIDADGRQLVGRAQSTDVIVASARALMDALHGVLAIGPLTEEAVPVVSRR
ncbi:MAG: 2-isopropylmalate synthase [Acidobacteria bacterium]|nr:2-isopropylmalate synthase [Acidobacteriota bacterium]MDW7983402.1 2-isopropylmalate synthase [Acidobacteriota bacterium]